MVSATVESPATSADQPLIESLISRGWSDAPTGLLGLMGALQVVAVMLGATAVVIAWGRRSK